MITSKESNLFKLNVRYTPEELISIAEKMKEENIISIHMQMCYDGEERYVSCIERKNKDDRE